MTSKSTMTTKVRTARSKHGLKNGRLTQEKLKELIHYDPETGEFMRRLRPCAGAKHHRIKIGGVYYQAHQLAWLYVTGQIVAQIDHEDLDGLNNKFINLRLCTHAENMRNRKTPKNCESGVKGIRQSPSGRWRARIIFNRQYYHLGMFDTCELAKEFRDLASDLLHREFANHE
jgi:hypothetical protein